MLRYPPRVANSIVLNGSPQEVGRLATVRDLLDSHGLESAKVAVELNREIVPRAAHDSTTLKNGDTLEIVTFVGGG